jgi:IS30 family transposase
MAKHRTLEERDRISHFNSRGFVQAAIAKSLCRGPLVISREVRRNGNEDGMS